MFKENFFQAIEEQNWIVLEVYQEGSKSENPEYWYVVDLKELILSFNQAIGSTLENIMNILGIDYKSLK